MACANFFRGINLLSIGIIIIHVGGQVICATRTCTYLHRISFTIAPPLQIVVESVFEIHLVNANHVDDVVGGQRGALADDRIVYIDIRSPPPVPKTNVATARPKCFSSTRTTARTCRFVA